MDEKYYTASGLELEMTTPRDQAPLVVYEDNLGPLHEK